MGFPGRMLALLAGVIALHPAPVLAGQGAPAAAAPAAIINDLPILGLAQVSIKVSDLAKARHFYGNVLGFAEAFTIRDKAGRISSLYMKVNDEQFVELIPVETIELVRQTRLVIQSSNLAALHRIYAEKGLQPGPISIGPDGNQLFRMLAPNSFPLDFIEYAPGSRQARLKGKLLDAKRISGRLLQPRRFSSRWAGASCCRARAGITSKRRLQIAIWKPRTRRSIRITRQPSASTRARYMVPSTILRWRSMTCTLRGSS